MKQWTKEKNQRIDGVVLGRANCKTNPPFLQHIGIFHARAVFRPSKRFILHFLPPRTNANSSTLRLRRNHRSLSRVTLLTIVRASDRCTWVSVSAGTLAVETAMLLQMCTSQRACAKTKKLHRQSQQLSNHKKTSALR